MQNRKRSSVLCSCSLLSLVLMDGFSVYFFLPQIKHFCLSPERQRFFLQGRGRETYHLNEFARNIFPPLLKHRLLTLLTSFNTLDLIVLPVWGCTGLGHGQGRSLGDLGTLVRAAVLVNRLNFLRSSIHFLGSSIHFLRTGIISYHTRHLHVLEYFQLSNAHPTW